MNKREGYRRVANIVSWVLFSCMTLFVVALAIWEIPRYVGEYARTFGKDEIVELGGILLVWLGSFFLPRLTYKAGCHIADGFKSE
ncbi:hypothetical protein [Alteromonas sp. CYL-A6]|uniref:hypothetical protein n=1 Tax=Alteromonas nitratireducens TaxID=3390813 RepID=UPI0034AF8C7A